MENPAQTIAQAVQAATQAQQQAQQQASQSQSPSLSHAQPASSSAIDNLTCQWQGCGERCDSAETLYDHVCERHVGRKSTNNLNLTCQWGACRTTTVKRDHITSHIRVHVPLKPHKCDFCGKSFKRPQDLKKHVKTHADDSVLANSPHAGTAGRITVPAGPIGAGGKPGYYTGSHEGLNGYAGYASALAANGTANGYTSTSNQYAGYGSVSYPNSAAMADIQSMDTRRRAIEALNDFLGDIKRRSINPQSYYDVGHRLQGNSLPLPINSSGYNTGYSNPSSGYNGMSAASLIDSFSSHEPMNTSAPMHAAGHQAYSLPLPNARTKSDLQDIDRFLEQLQATVYETSTQAEAAGVQQPGLHTQYGGNYNSHAGSWGHVYSGGSVHRPTSADTPPGLTPGSNASYSSSSHSPMSTHSRASLSSNISEPMYPNLPSVPGMSEGLASGLGNDARRMSGGMLQRAPERTRTAADEDTEMVDADADDGSRTPKASEAKAAAASPKAAPKSPNSPTVRVEDTDAASTPAARSESEDKREEGWVENMRTIEALRKYISDRLTRGDYEEEGAAKEANQESASKIAETAKLVEEKMADALAAETRKMSAEAAKEKDEKVEYPTLPTETTTATK